LRAPQARAFFGGGLDGRLKHCHLFFKTVSFILRRPVRAKSIKIKKMQYTFWWALPFIFEFPAPPLHLPKKEEQNIGACGGRASGGLW